MNDARINATLPKSQLLKSLQQEREQWWHLLDAIGAESMKQPGVAGYWSVKDVVAHVTAYESWLLAWMQAGLHGEMAPPSLLDGGDTDERNGRVYAAIHSLPLPDVLRQADETFRALLDLIAALPDELLTQPQQAAWFTAHWHSVTTFSEAIINLTIDHYHEHLPDLRRWLEKTTP